jgi:Na+-driven multidrug efflux pump
VRAWGGHGCAWVSLLAGIVAGTILLALVHRRIAGSANFPHIQNLSVNSHQIDLADYWRCWRPGVTPVTVPESSVT